MELAKMGPDWLFDHRTPWNRPGSCFSCHKRLRDKQDARESSTTNVLCSRRTPVDARGSGSGNRAETIRVQWMRSLVLRRPSGSRGYCDVETMRGDMDSKRSE